MKSTTNLLGQKFGAFLVIGPAHNPPKHRIYWRCRCECGRELDVCQYHMIHGATKSCGCRRNVKNKTHGLSKTRIYGIWEGVLARCTNPNISSYARYGGRGISFDSRWKRFENFLEDVGFPPTDKHTLDRIDGDGDYIKSNVRWATQKEQLNNMSRNRWITANGETHTLTQWCEKMGMSLNALRGRIDKLNWTVEKAINTPVRKCNRR